MSFRSTERQTPYQKDGEPNVFFERAQLAVDRSIEIVTEFIRKVKENMSVSKDNVFEKNIDKDKKDREYDISL